jgi:Tol biopolymer transport system component
MAERKSFIVVGGIIGCLVVLFCIGVIALAGIAFLGNREILARSVDRIAYMDNELNIQVVDARGEHRVALTSDAKNDNDLAYLYPTWAPNSQRVAFVRVSGTRSSFEGTLYTAPLAGGEPATVFKSKLLVPFYLYWSPDSQHISFLAQSDTEVNLMLGEAEGKEETRKLDTGSPLYWAWSPDSRTMLTHIGGSQRDSRGARLGLLRWQGESASQKLTQGPASFQAPQFSPDGSQMLYAGAGESNQDALYIADAQGAQARSVASYAGRIGFAWAPNGKKIAWVATPADALLPNLGPVSISDTDGNNSKTLGNDDALAFYWSPDSKQIAYLSLIPPGSQGCNDDCQRVPGLAAPMEQGASLRMRWRIADTETGQARTLVSFVPTANFVTLLPYFDQYARSLTFWSPDSQQFVYTQREAQGQGSVWVIGLKENAAPAKIGDGTLAVWSWK